MCEIVLWEDGKIVVIYVGRIFLKCLWNGLWWSFKSIWCLIFWKIVCKEICGLVGWINEGGMNLYMFIWSDFLKIS